MSDDINPYAPPATEIPPASGNPLHTWTLLTQGWQIYRTNFLRIAVIVTVVWLPCELVSSYMDTFVFGEEEFMKSLKFSQFLENFFGIIATAGVLSMALRHTAGGSVSLGEAFGTGFSLWPKMWWTRFLSTLVLVISFLLLVVPFFILYPRLILVESVVVGEHDSGVSALKRSYELTRGCFWQIFRLFIVLSLVLITLSFALTMLSEFIPALDHWLADAVVYLLCDILAAYETVTLYCAYQACLTRQNEANPV